MSHLVHDFKLHIEFVSLTLLICEIVDFHFTIIIVQYCIISVFCCGLWKAMEKSKLMEELLKLESPFSWGIPEVDDIPIDQFIQVEKEKFESISEENEFKWTRFIISLLLSFEIADKMEHSHAEALSYVQWCQNHLKTQKNQDCKEPLFLCLYPTLRFVTSVTEAIILLKSDEVEKARKVSEEWLFSSGATSTASAALLGTRAALYLQYGTKGHRLALTTATQARDLDPDQGEWWYIIGNALGRIRRTEQSSISPQEIEAVEKAFALERNATYIVNLAQLYAEYGSQSFYQDNDQEKAKKYARKAVQRYREAISLRPNCPLLKARVAHGMLRIKDREARDIPFAKSLLDEVVGTTECNSMVYHDLGYYFERYKRDTNQALACLKKSNAMGNIKALTFMVNLKWRHGLEEEIAKDLREGLTRFHSVEGQAQLLAYLGAIQALVDDDWAAACESFQKCLTVDPSAKFLENFQGFDNKNVNLLELVVNYVNNQVTKGLQQTPQAKAFLDSVLALRPNIIHPPRTKYLFVEWKKDLLKVNKKPKRF